MTWTTPPTFSDGSVLTAAQLNLIRDDLNECPAAKATTAGSMFAVVGANSVIERQWLSSKTTAVETTASTGYVELATIQNITVVTNANALIIVSARLFMGTVDTLGLANWLVSGASSISADDNNALQVNSSTVNSRVRASAVTVCTTLTAGTNVFKAVYKTGGAGTLTAASRELLVLPL